MVEEQQQVRMAFQTREEHIGDTNCEGSEEAFASAVVDNCSSSSQSSTNNDDDALVDLNLGLRLGPLKKKETAATPAVATSEHTTTRTKRGFSETVKNHSLPPMFPWNVKPLSVDDRRTRTCIESLNKKEEAAPLPSSPVVGWPPVQSFRKNTLVAPSPTKKPSADKKSTAEARDTSTIGQQKQQQQRQQQQQFIKVYMDGVKIGRKLDLDTNDSYSKLSTVLNDMFRGFFHGGGETKQMNLFDGSDYVLTYEDKDGDLMLVGDVPWGMFTATVKRLRIMKGSDAIGLVPKECEEMK